MTNCIEHKKLSEEQLEELISIIRDRQKKICTKCACPLNPSKQKKYLGICSNKDCKYRQRTFQSTIFSGSKLDRIIFMRVLELWCMKASHKIIAYCLDISRQAVTSVIRRLKAEINNKNDTCADKIGGDGVIVEIDESKFGKRKYNRGHRIEGVWVFGMVERSAERKIKLVVVDDRKAETLMESLTKFVDTSSIIHSDQWKGYKDV